MPFEKGHKLGGRRKEKHFYDALMVRLKACESDNKRGLMRIADQLIKQAEDGDMQAIKEIADRLDGKPTQESHNTNTYDATDKFVEILRAMQDQRQIESNAALPESTEDAEHVH